MLANFRIRYTFKVMSAEGLSPIRVDHSPKYQEDGAVISAYLYSFDDKSPDRPTPYGCEAELLASYGSKDTDNPPGERKTIVADDGAASFAIGGEESVAS